MQKDSISPSKKQLHLQSIKCAQETILKSKFRWNYAWSDQMNATARFLINPNDYTLRSQNAIKGAVYSKESELSDKSLEGWKNTQKQAAERRVDPWKITESFHNFAKVAGDSLNWVYKKCTATET